jgi:hypothetical protein
MNENQKETATAPDAERAQDLIVGRWEGNDGAVEFTSSGTVVIPGPRPKVANYRFLDNTMIEVTSPGEVLRLMQVAVTRTDLSFMVMGRGKATYHRVKEYSARIQHGGKLPPTRKGRPVPSSAKAAKDKLTKDKPATPTKGP